MDTLEAFTNRIIAIGTLDPPVSHRRDARRPARNALRGSERYAALQVVSPFGQAFALPVSLAPGAAGAELIDGLAGTPLLAEGWLRWSQREDRRYAASPAAPGRSAAELTFVAHTLREPPPASELGCDVWLSGVVLGAPRIQRHPHRRSVLLAQTTLRVTVERRRSGSRACMVESERVQVVAPLDHPDAPNLLRPGNQVRLEGMLERVVVELGGPDVERAQSALDVEWSERRGALRPEELRDAERRYGRRRRSLGESLQSRVVAGYIELVAGAPATLREARSLREAEVRARRASKAE